MGSEALTTFRKNFQFAQPSALVFQDFLLLVAMEYTCTRFSPNCKEAGPSELSTLAGPRAAAAALNLRRAQLLANVHSMDPSGHVCKHSSIGSPAQARLLTSKYTRRVHGSGILKLE